MRIDKSDFVMQHKNTGFNELYKAEPDKILGQGKSEFYYLRYRFIYEILQFKKGIIDRVI